MIKGPEPAKVAICSTLALLRLSDAVKEKEDALRISLN